MSKRKPSSDELRAEAKHRYRELAPLSTIELDALLRWASEKHANVKRPHGELDMLVGRLLLAGRADSLLSSPQEGHAEVRLREMARAAAK